MDKITEIVSGNSIYVTMLNSRLGQNQILNFNTYFSIADISDISDYKIEVSNNICGRTLEYDFGNEMKLLDAAIKNNNKIRVWCSYQDADSYILLTFICNYLKSVDKEIDVYVVYSDDYNNIVMSPSLLRENELEEASAYEKILSKRDIISLAKIWNTLEQESADIRIMQNGNVKFVNVDYFNKIILDKLSILGEVKQIKLVSELLREYHLLDLIFVNLIDKLIECGRINVIEKDVDGNKYNDIISVK